MSGTNRKYSVEEIDRMRSSVMALWIGAGRSSMPNEMEIAVEQQLRTYMLNGTDPEELEKRVLEMRASFRGSI